MTWRWTPLLILLGIAAVGRGLLLASGSVSFHSDEAVVGLMARHILEGGRPTFFYGQAYMGSLDAWWTALGFVLFGQTPLSIHLMQSMLYLATLTASYAAALRITGSIRAATVTGLILAVPPVLIANYTSATLGGYGETLLLGALILLLGYDVAQQGGRGLWKWALLGLLTGIGWWTNALIAVYAAPVVLVILLEQVRTLVRYLRGIPRAAFRLSEQRPYLLSLRTLLGRIAIALIAFIVGSTPWWMFALQNDLAPLRFLIGGGDAFGGSAFAGSDVFSLPFDQRVIGLFLIGLPALFGVRFPWSPEYFLPLIGVLVYVIFAFALIHFIRTKTIPAQSKPIILIMIGMFAAVFLFSRFSFDPTGRYLLPLALPCGIAFGVLIDALWTRQRIVAGLVVVLVVGYFAAGQIAAARSYPGFTTQFNLDTHIPPDDDAALIAYLSENGLTHGYTQYWVSFRIAFLSGERLRYSATIPYLPSLSYTPFDERYPPYRALSDAADNIAVIVAVPTPNVAIIRERLESWFAIRGLRYVTRQIGVYTIYHQFDPPPRPPFDL